jgi:hypothetical protein
MIVDAHLSITEFERGASRVARALNPAVPSMGSESFVNPITAIESRQLAPEAQ